MSHFGSRLDCGSSNRAWDLKQLKIMMLMLPRSLGWLAQANHRDLECGTLKNLADLFCPWFAIF